MHESGYYETATSDSTPEESVVIVSSGTFEIPVEKDVDNPHAGCVSGYGLDRYEKATRLFQDSVHSVSKLLGVEYSGFTVGEQELLQQLKHENDKLKQALTVAQVTEAPLSESQALLDLQNKCDVLVKEVQEKKHDLAEGEKNKHEVELKLSQALRHFEEAKKKVEQLEASVIDKDRELTEQAENFGRKTSELEYQLADVQKQIRVQSESSMAPDIGVFQVQRLGTERKSSSESEQDVFQQKLSQILQEKDDELGQKNKALENLETELYDTQRQLEDIQLKYDFLMSKGCAQKVINESELSNQLKLIEELKNKCAELEGTSLPSSQEINRLQSRNKELENECRRINDELQKMLTRCKQLEETVHALHEYGLIMKKRSDDAKWRCGELEHVIRTNNVGMYNSLLEKDMNDAKWRCGELEASVKNKSEELNTLHLTKDMLETKLKSAYEDLERQKSNFEKQLNESRAQEQDYVSRINAIQHELHVVQRQLEGTRRKLESKTPDDERDQLIKELETRLQYAETRYDETVAEFKKKTENDKENNKWKFYELESALSMMNKDLQEQQAKAVQREDELLAIIDEKTREIEEIRTSQ